MSSPEWMPRAEIVAPFTEAEREAVKVAQRALDLSETGDYNEATRGALRGIQRLLGIPVTGFLDSPTAIALERLRPPGLRD